MIHCGRVNLLALPLGAIVIAFAAEGCAPSSSGAPNESCGPTIRWVQLPGERVRIEVAGADVTASAELAKAGLSAEKAMSFFTVTVDQIDTPGNRPRTPMLGSYRVTQDLIIFEPRFPLQPGLRYRAQFDRDKFQNGLRSVASPAEAPKTKAEPVSTVFVLPVVAAETTAITGVFPTRDELPENLLRFYIHFSAPMSRGEAYEYTHLLDGLGKAVDFPFLEIPQELWDPLGERFTLVFDPGRVKKGLKPREEVGPILEAGKTYTLVIDGDWPDAQGNKLAGELRKTFRATAEDAKCPDPREWVVVPPSQSTDPLTLRFPEPLDHAMLGRVIGVADVLGTPIAGQVAIDAEETRWRDTPERPWSPGTYKVVVDQSLEDLAGNSIARPFEVDVFTRSSVRCPPRVSYRLK